MADGVFWINKLKCRMLYFYILVAVLNPEKIIGQRVKIDFMKVSFRISGDDK
jgi:hypothetical protein